MLRFVIAIWFGIGNPAPIAARGNISRVGFPSLIRLYPSYPKGDHDAYYFNQRDEEA